MSDDPLWRDFVRRYGPGGAGDPKEAAPSSPKRAASPAPGAPARSLTADDADAWNAFVADFEGPAASPTPPAPPPPSPNPPPERSLTADDTDAWSAFVADFEQPTGSSAPVPSPPPRPSSRAGAPAERRDRTDYDRRVDLHGLSRRAAAELLGRRLFEARLMGLESLLVITGRGLHSAAGPVLRLWLPEWAARQADGAPLRCEEADPAIGGPGAFLLWV